MKSSVLVAGVLDAASVLVDVLFAVVVAVAVLVALDLGRRSWRSVRDRQADRRQDDEPREPVPVTSWRPDTDRPATALPAPPRSRSRSAGTYGTRRAGRRFPEDPGRLL